MSRSFTCCSRGEKSKPSAILFQVLSWLVSTRTIKCGLIVRLPALTLATFVDFNCLLPTLNFASHWFHLLSNACPDLFSILQIYYFALPAQTFFVSYTSCQSPVILPPQYTQSGSSNLADLNWKLNWTLKTYFKTCKKKRVRTYC